MAAKENLSTEDLTKYKSKAKRFGWGAWISCVAILVSAFIGSSMDKPDTAATIMKVGGLAVVVLTGFAWHFNTKALNGETSAAEG